MNTVKILKDLIVFNLPPEPFGMVDEKVQVSENLLLTLVTDEEDEVTVCTLYLAINTNEVHFKVPLISISLDDLLHKKMDWPEYYRVMI